MIRKRRQARKKVLYLAQEIYPYLEDSKVGKDSKLIPLGIMGRGNDIRTFMPNYGVINYLLTITRNECIDHLRKMRYTTPMSTLSEQQLWMIEERLHSLEVLEAPNPMEEDIIFKLERALSDLPPRQQQILRMYRFEGQSYKEIADQLQISPRTVEAQLRIAMKKLRESMPLMLLIWWKLLS